MSSRHPKPASPNPPIGPRAPCRPIALTTKQKRLIRESFLKLEPALDLVGQLFYLKLLPARPGLPRPLRRNAETQGRKFMAALKLGIISLNHDDGLAPTLKLLGVRHRQLGIKMRHYRTMTKALMWTLEQSLEKQLHARDQGRLVDAAHPDHPHAERRRRGSIAERWRFRRLSSTTFTPTAPFSSTGSPRPGRARALASCRRRELIRRRW